MVYVETNSYVAAHGKNPRGFGGWWFEIGGGVTVQTKVFTGLYSKAKREAKEWAKERGVTAVRVLS